MENKDTGLLLNKKNIGLNRGYFKNMLKLWGINVFYRAPRNSKEYDMYGELDTLSRKFKEPIATACIFEEHPNVKTTKLLGWNAERGEQKPIIHVPYDLPGVQVGGLFIIPSALDNTKGRVFRILDMSTIAVYPYSISCELGPVLESEFEETQKYDYSKSDFNVLNDEEDD